MTSPLRQVPRDLAPAAARRLFIGTCLASLRLAPALSAQSRGLPILRTKEIPGVGTECSDPEFGVSFRLPLEWRLHRAGRWPDAGERATTAILRDPGSDAFVGLYYRLFRRPAPLSIEDAQADMRAHVDAKVSQRVREGVQAFRVRADTYANRLVGGQPAVSCLADYRLGERAMVEDFTWIRSSRMLAQFFCKMRPEELDGFRECFEPVVRSLVIP